MLTTTILSLPTTSKHCLLSVLIRCYAEYFSPGRNYSECFF